MIRRSAESRATVPDLELEVEVELARDGLGADVRGRSRRVVLAAAARALREHRRLNGAYRDGHYELHGRVNAGVVLGEQASYPVATVFDADELEPRGDRRRARAAARAGPPRASSRPLSSPGPRSRSGSPAGPESTARCCR